MSDLWRAAIIAGVSSYASARAAQSQTLAGKGDKGDKGEKGEKGDPGAVGPIGPAGDSDVDLAPRSRPGSNPGLLRSVPFAKYAIGNLRVKAKNMVLVQVRVPSDRVSGISALGLQAGCDWAIAVYRDNQNSPGHLIKAWNFGGAPWSNAVFSFSSGLPAGNVALGKDERIWVGFLPRTTVDGLPLIQGTMDVHQSHSYLVNFGDETPLLGVWADNPPSSIEVASLEFPVTSPSGLAPAVFFSEG